MKYKYIGECKGNDNNGCFMDRCGNIADGWTEEVITVLDFNKK